MRRGRYFTLNSNLQLARGFHRFSDGTFGFSGSTKRAVNVNFQYYAVFAMRIDPFASKHTPSSYSCMTMNDIPDDRAYEKVNINPFVDARDSRNPDLKS